MSKLINLVGLRFGNLTVVSRAEKRPNKRTYFNCVCDCGNECVVDAEKLRNGITRSCGCIKGKLISQSKTRHGYSHTRLHNIWVCMKRRCYPSHPQHNDYYDRGIRVCEEWSGKNGFDTFLDWALKSGYNEELSIDRIDNNKGYYPENCRWATPKQQGNNKRNNVVTFYNGKKVTAKELSEILGCSRFTCAYHIKRGRNGNEIERRLEAYGNKQY